MTSHETHHEDHEMLELEIQGELVELLSEYPLYESDAPIAQYVHSRVIALSNAPNNIPRIYVRDSPDENACIIGKTLVVDRGIFDLLGNAEEIDAVLSHELTHLDKDHVHESQGLSGTANIGKQRIHEIESDLRGMIRLDQKGINPRGMISMMEKLAAAQEKKSEPQTDELDHAPKTSDISDITDEELMDIGHPSPPPRWARTSPVHGVTRERAVNLEQAAWLIDLKHLSPAPLTPHELGSYGRLEHDTTTSDDPNHHQAIIGRKAAALARQTTVEPESMAELTAAQQQVLEMYNPLCNAGALAPLALSKYGLKLPKAMSHADYVYVMGGLQDPALQKAVGDMRSQRRKFARNTLIDFMNRSQPSDEIVEILRDATVNENKGQVNELRTFVTTHAVRTIASDITKSAKAAALINETEAPLEPFISKLSEHDRPTEIHTVREVARDIAAVRYNQALGHEAIVDFLHYVSGKPVQEIFVDTLGDSTAHTSTSEAHFWYKMAFTDSLSNLYTNIRMAEISYYEFDDSFFIPGGLLRSSDKVIARIVDSCINMTPDELGHALMARNDLTTEEKITISHFWLDYRNEISNLPPEMHFNTMGLLFSAHSPDFIKRAEDLLQYQATQVVNKVNDPAKKEIETGYDPELSLKNSVDAFMRVIKDSLEPFAITDEEQARKNELLDELFNQSRIVRGYRTLAALEAFNQKGSIQPLLKMLEEGSIIKLENTIFSESDVLQLGRAYWEEAAAKVLKRPDLLKKESNLKLLIALGIVSDDVEINLHVPSSALAMLVEARSFRKGLELIFGTYDKLPHYAKTKAIDILIEQKAKTLDDFAELEAFIGKRMESLIDTHLTGIGAGSIVESIIVEAYKSSRETTRESGLMKERIYSAETVELISALLTSAESDEAVKAYVFNRWWLANRYSPRNEQYFRVEDILTHRHRGKEARLNYWIKELPPVGTYEPLSNIVDKLYLADDNVRFMLVRKLMLGEGGILKEEGGKEALVESFMQSWLKSEEGSPSDALLRNLLHSYLNSASAERVYQYISPVLQDLILKPPKTSSSNRDIAVARAEQIVDSLIERKKLDPNTMTGNEIPAVRNKIFFLMHGTSDLDEIRRTGDNAGMLDLFGVESDDGLEQVSPTELALLVGKKAGALGVRMLQLAGQYYAIPDDERPKFNEVYDSMKGQKRIQAYKLLLREAEDNPKMRELLDNVKIFGERLGGGSLMTVYGATMADGSKRVIGVRNPNAEFHVIQIADVLQKTLAAATQEDPDNLDLKIAESLVVDAVRWIRDELNDTDFVHKDPVFRAENDTRTGRGFKKGRSRYDLYIPQAYDTGTPWVRHEDYVPGVNLNNLIIADDEATDLANNKISKADYQDAVSLLVRNTMHQVQNGTYVHSDGHGGNFRITADNKSVAVFDRYNLLEINDSTRQTLEKTITNVALGNRQEAVEAIIGGVRPDLSGAQVSQIASSVAANLEDEEDVAKSMMSTLIELKKSNVEIPVGLSLILRNMFSMTQLSQKAGFDDIVGAFMHTASEEEVEALMQRFGQ